VICNTTLLQSKHHEETCMHFLVLPELGGRLWLEGRK
jgi:hypothetical protein